MGGKSLILLVGQSNMSGRGFLTENDIKEIPGLTAIRRDFLWIPAIDPFNFDRLNALGLNDSRDPFEVRGLTIGENRRCGVGPGRTFGRLFLEKFPGKEVGLIPASIGGTPISAWLPGGKDPYSDAYPYDDSIVLARKAMEQGEIAAVLWHQGESDAADKTENYREKLETVIANFRKDLNLGDNVPFILGGLGGFLDPAWNADVYDQIIRQVAEITPGVGYASAENLVDRGDKLHFDTPSQYILGERYFAEYCRMTGK